MIGSGKDGNIYVVDTSNMGKFNPTSNDIYQELPGAVGGGEFGSPAAFNGQVYFGGVGATLRAFQFVNGKLQATPASQSSNTFGYPGTTPSISSDGNANGIVWAIDDGNSTAVLYAYDAANLSTMLYNSNQAPNGRDSVGPANKFITPTIANGKVYVATADGVAVFGLLSQTLTLSPVPDQTIPVNSSETVTLYGSDPNPNATLTYSAVAESLPYWLDQTYGLYENANGYSTNKRGQGEKYLQGTVSANSYKSAPVCSGTTCCPTGPLRVHPAVPQRGADRGAGGAARDGVLQQPGAADRGDEHRGAGGPRR